MTKLRYSISAIAIVTIATVAGSGRILATVAPSSVTSGNASSPTGLFPSTQAPDRLAQSNYLNDCRKVVQDYTQFYTNFPGSGGAVGGVGILNSGSRVRLLDGGQTYQGPNGRLYYRVSSPYASQNPSIGYISVNSPLVRCGHSARW